jgi:uncharacterized protein (DUF934 family)
MRYILRRREIVADDWRYLGEELTLDAPASAAGAAAAAATRGSALIVPLAELRRDPSHWRQWPGRLGVRLAPADPVEELAADIAGLGLVAVEFPNAGDGRGYSQGRLLRERLGFGGELRAVGNGVRQDQVFLLGRCGFDAFELAAGEDLEAARRALARYDVAYQPGVTPVDAVSALRRQRFTRQ